jgi:hypothetical protein
MKNIHLLPTDKPTRLWTNNLRRRLELDEFPSQHPTNIAKNIYITSDEKFVRDEYVTDGIEVIKVTSKLVDSQSLVDRRDWKKIIITIDQDLINDGIQAINDEFLEWFVKNPSCKFVEVKSNYRVKSGTIQEHKDGIAGYEYYEYKIIIPQEEPKQKTLEEAAEKWLNKDGFNIYNHYDTRPSFIAGAKWQAKRMYSEEEVKQIARFGFNAGRRVELKAVDLDFTFDKWYEQFKKK